MKSTFDTSSQIFSYEASPNFFRSSSTVPIPAMWNVSISTLATLGDKNAGNVGPKCISFTPRLSNASYTITAFCSYQAILYTIGKSLMSFNWNTSFNFRAITANE